MEWLIDLYRPLSAALGMSTGAPDSLLHVHGGMVILFLAPGSRPGVRSRHGRRFCSFWWRRLRKKPPIASRTADARQYLRRPQHDILALRPDLKQIGRAHV